MCGKINKAFDEVRWKAVLLYPAIGILILLIGVKIFGQKNFSQILINFAWPMLFVFVSIYFGDSISSFLNSVKSLKTPMAEVEVNDRVDKLLSEKNDTSNKKDSSHKEQHNHLFEDESFSEVEESNIESPSTVFKAEAHAQAEAQVETHDQFIKRVEGLTFSEVTADDISRYRGSVEPTENFSSFDYANFIYQHDILVPISETARTFLEHGNFIGLISNGSEVDIKYVTKAWDEVEARLRLVYINCGGTPHGPKISFDSGEREQITLLDQLTYLIEKDVIKPYLFKRFMAAKNAYDLMVSYYKDNVEVTRARNFVDLVISILNKL